MSRVQLALNVADLDDAIVFYSKLFGTAPAKVRPGYANFAVTEPPLKLILIAGNGEGGTLNHLGVEVESDAPGTGLRQAGELAHDPLALHPLPGRQQQRAADSGAESQHIESLSGSTVRSSPPGISTSESTV